MRGFIAVLIGVLAAGPAGAVQWRAAWDTFWERAPVRMTVEVHEAGEEVAYIAPTAPAVKLGDGAIRVTGYGAAPPDAASPAQARLMAIGAAKLDAQRQLAVVLRGVDVEAASASADYVQTRYTVSEETHVFLKGIRVLSTRFFEDGTAEVDLEVVLAGSPRAVDFASLEGFRVQTPGLPKPNPMSERVTSVALLEDESEALPKETQATAEPEIELPAAADAPAETREATDGVEDTPSPIALAKSAPAPAAVAEPQPPVAEDGPYTDLVLDARGLHAKPALQPRGLLADGTQLYPFEGGILGRFAPEREPELRYAKSLEAAQALPGFGGRPLVIAIEALYGDSKTDVVISKGALMKLMPLRKSRLMQGEGYVIILID